MDQSDKADNKKSFLMWRHTDSIFIKCLYMLAISSALTIGLVTYKSTHATEMVANESILKIGTEVTRQLASRNLAPLQFRKSDDISQVLRSSVDEMGGSASGALVMALDGEVLAEEFLDGESPDLALEAVRAALESGETVINAERLVIAIPMYIGADRRLIGAIGFDWRSDVLYEIAGAQNRNSLLLATGLGIVMLVVVGFLIRRMVARPLLAVANAMNEVAKGNYGVEIPKYRRGNEIGIVARALEQFRDQLAASDAARKDAAMTSAALDAGSAAIMIADANLDIVYASSAVLDLLHDHKELISERSEGFDPENVVGQPIEAFQLDASMERGKLEEIGEEGNDASLEMGDVTLSLKLSKIGGEDGVRICKLKMTAISRRKAGRHSFAGWTRGALPMQTKRRRR